MSEPAPPRTHHSKVALVTGSNKGIGREIARQLSLLGMTVFASARNRKRGEQTARELRAEGGDVHFLRLDVTDERSIERAARHIEEVFGHLDVLVNNAGITVDEERPSKDRPSSEVRPSSITANQMRRVYDVNVFGVVAVTRALLPLLRRAQAARIVNMSSPLGSLALRSDREHPVASRGILAYPSSKAALNVITLQYAYELRDAGILVNAATPGYVATDLNNHAGNRSPEAGAKIAVYLSTLDDNGPTGTFLDDDGPVPW